MTFSESLGILRRRVDRDDPVAGEDLRGVDLAEVRARRCRSTYRQEGRVGEQADPAGQVVVDGVVAGADQRPLNEPRGLADLAMGQGRQDRRQGHGADDQDDQDHDQELDEGETPSWIA